MADDTIVSRMQDEDAAYVRHKLIEYNSKHVTGAYEPIQLAIRDESGDIVAGLVGKRCWNWVEVDILWVDERYRRHGYGSRLLAEAESLAAAKGADFVKLNTFGFQAPDFYRKHGYEVLCVIEDAPRGSRHYYLKKSINRID
ncbi:GNAT family N-acetyltransferase [Paenibacillus flagellatus]|uniref:Histone acetyltransferase n=1 Tax=Paenibacillus flagellatus TaxID=2211139 RepID=A0A2V5JVJ4_9BACL|nr:GNAT family N-acetyltransferase [Paenibacillus flagellatus]PYI50511.1 histone acetyltransferase [Paenibacillus flagellatus]